MIIISIFYYVLSILAMFMAYYFRRFTWKDYQNDASLNHKRQGVVIFMYVMFALQCQIIGLNTMIIYDVQGNTLITNSAFFFFFMYIFMISIVAKRPVEK